MWPIDYDNNGLTDFVVTNGNLRNTGPVELITVFRNSPGAAATQVPATPAPIDSRATVNPFAATVQPVTPATSSNQPLSLNPPVLVSADLSGKAGAGDSVRSSVSADGRYVAFDSWADGLVNSDHNLKADVFVRDTVGGSTQLVSASSSGGAADKPSGAPKITPDGRYVVFYSYASNLVAGVANNVSHIFVRDLHTGTTRVVDTAADGTLADAESGSPSISGDGCYVAFQSNADDLLPGDDVRHVQVFVKDMQTGAVTLASADTNGGFGNHDSIQPDITPNGRYVAFTSNASDLTAPADTKLHWDVFLRDVPLGTTVKVNVPLAGREQGAAEGPSVSGDGHYVSFTSTASNLVASPVSTHAISNIFVRDLVIGVTTKISSTATDAPLIAQNTVSSASPDNRHVAWTSNTTAITPDPSRSFQIYERDMAGWDTQAPPVTTCVARGAPVVRKTSSRVEP